MRHCEVKGRCMRAICVRQGSESPGPTRTCCSNLRQLAGLVKNVGDKKAICQCLKNAGYGQCPEGEKNFSEHPCCHSRHHHRTATVAAAFERPVVASATEEPIRTGSDDRAAFVASTITPFLVELHLTDGDATIVSVGRFAAEIG
ncbi:hypothetical protein LWI29_024607 [Acer saccharum]|uniref:Uncharacterized protein n=1 Tax=Acer saccharum TaxID=4024 RepID=A0AA39RWL1_ACESA|nr:hypothetical protein LWI29_024607 [Acer saccharum]